MRITPEKLSKYMDKTHFVEYLTYLLEDYCKKYKDYRNEPWVVDDDTFSIRDLLNISRYCAPKGKFAEIDQFINQLSVRQKVEVFDLLIQDKKPEADYLMFQSLANTYTQVKLKIYLVKFIGKSVIREAITKYADSAY